MMMMMMGFRGVIVMPITGRMKEVVGGPLLYFLLFVVVGVGESFVEAWIQILVLTDLNMKHGTRVEITHKTII